MKLSDMGGQFQNSTPRLPNPHGQGPRQSPRRGRWPHEGHGKLARLSPLNHAPTASDHESSGSKDTPQASHRSSIPFPPASNTWRPTTIDTPLVTRRRNASSAVVTAAR